MTHRIKSQGTRRLLALGAGLLLARYSNGPLETMIRRFDWLLGGFESK